MKNLITIIIGVLFSTAILSQNLMTIGEVFDFEVGDKFQYTGNGLGQTTNADRITIIDKYYFADSNTVFYLRSHDSYHTYLEYYELIYVFWTDTTTVSYTNLESSISNVSDWTSYNPEMVIYDTVNFNSENYCDSLINGYSYQMYTFEPVYYEKHWAKGLGLVKDFYDAPSAYSMFDNVLFYYEKNGISCGTPDITVSIQENEQFNNFSINPNPADKFFKINNTSEKPFRMEIYTINGEQIVSKLLEESNCVFNCESINPGMYIIRFSQESRSWMRKLLIK